jgi:hypothetical protein
MYSRCKRRHVRYKSPSPNAGVTLNALGETLKELAAVARLEGRGQIANRIELRVGQAKCGSHAASSSCFWYHAKTMSRPPFGCSLLSKLSCKHAVDDRGRVLRHQHGDDASALRQII